MISSIFQYTSWICASNIILFLGAESVPKTEGLSEHKSVTEAPAVISGNALRAKNCAAENINRIPEMHQTITHACIGDR